MTRKKTEFEIAFEAWAEKQGHNITNKQGVYVCSKTVAAFCGFEAGLRHGKELAHMQVCSVLKGYGVSDGTKGWIEHSDSDDEPLRRDPFTIEGEMLFGIEAIIEQVKVGAGKTADELHNAELSDPRPRSNDVLCGEGWPSAAAYGDLLSKEKAMARKKMKVFVWEGVLTDYTSGMMFAIAPTVEEARARLLKECKYIPDGDLNQQPKEFDLSESAAFVCWGGG